MVGARDDEATVHYPVDELAARHGASVEHPTDDPAEAYADWSPRFEPTKLDWPPSS
jgi:hypothetical protein